MEGIKKEVELKWDPNINFRRFYGWVLSRGWGKMNVLSCPWFCFSSFFHPVTLFTRPKEERKTKTDFLITLSTDLEVSEGLDRALVEMFWKRAKMWLKKSRNVNQQWRVFGRRLIRNRRLWKGKFSYEWFDGGEERVSKCCVEIDEIFQGYYSSVAERSKRLFQILSSFFINM